MANISTRIRKLEAQLTVRTGPAPCSNEWFALWEARIERLVAGEAPERIGRIPLEVIDQMRERHAVGVTESRKTVANMQAKIIGDANSTPIIRD